VVCLGYVQQAFDLFSLFCEVSCFSDKTAYSCSELRTKAVDVGYAYIFVAHVA